MKKTEENVIEAAIEALEFWHDGKGRKIPNAIGCVIIRYAELLHQGVVSEEITKLGTGEYAKALKEMIGKKYCSCCGHKLEKKI